MQGHPVMKSCHFTALTPVLARHTTLGNSTRTVFDWLGGGYERRLGKHLGLRAEINYTETGEDISRFNKVSGKVSLVLPF